MTDFGDIPIEDHGGLILLYDDTMPAYRVAAALVALVDAYPERDAFRESRHSTPGRDDTSVGYSAATPTVSSVPYSR